MGDEVKAIRWGTKFEQQDLEHRQITDDVEQIVGKQVVAVFTEDFARSIALAFDDGSFILLKGSGWEEHTVEIDDDRPEDATLVAIGLMSAEQAAAREAARQRVRDEQWVRDERRTLKALKKKYEGTDVNRDT